MSQSVGSSTMLNICELKQIQLTAPVWNGKGAGFVTHV